MNTGWRELEREMAIGLELFVTAIALLITGIVQLGFESESISDSIEGLASSQGGMVSLQEVTRLHREFESSQDKLTEAGIYLFVLMFTISTTNYAVRRWGWSTTNSGDVTPNRFGIWFQTVISVLILFVVSAWIN